MLNNYGQQPEDYQQQAQYLDDMPGNYNPPTAQQQFAGQQQPPYRQQQQPVPQSSIPPLDMQVQGQAIGYQPQDPSMIQPQSARAQGQPISPYVANTMQPPSPGMQMTVHPVQQPGHEMVAMAPPQNAVLMEQPQQAFYQPADPMMPATAGPSQPVVKSGPPPPMVYGQEQPVVYMPMDQQQQQQQVMYDDQIYQEDPMVMQQYNAPQPQYVPAQQPVYSAYPEQQQQQFQGQQPLRVPQRFQPVKQGIQKVDVLSAAESRQMFQQQSRINQKFASEMDPEPVIYQAPVKSKDSKKSKQPSPKRSTVKSTYPQQREISPKIKVVQGGKAGYNADHEQDPTPDEWMDIQRRIDQQYEKKLKQVSNDAMLKLKQFQHEHKSLQQKTQYMIDNTNQQMRPPQAQQRVDQFGGQYEPLAPIGQSSMYVKSSSSPNRFFTPQVKSQSEVQQSVTMPKQFQQVDAQTVRNLHQEFQSVLQNYDGDLYLVDILDYLKLLPEDLQTVQFLRQSSQNMMIKQADMPESEDLTKNLFRIFCSIVKVQLNQRASSFLDERVIQQYLDSVNLERDVEMIYIDELSAIKGLINRPTYALTDRQVKLIHEKFRNMYQNRIDFINFQQRPVIQQSMTVAKPVQQIQSFQQPTPMQPSNQRPVVKSSPRRDNFPQQSYNEPTPTGYIAQERNSARGPVRQNYQPQPVVKSQPPVQQIPIVPQQQHYYQEQPMQQYAPTPGFQPVQQQMMQPPQYGQMQPQQQAPKTNIYQPTPQGPLEPNNQFQRPAPVKSNYHPLKQPSGSFNEPAYGKTIIDTDANQEQEEIADYFSEPPARFQTQKNKLEGTGEQLSFGAKSVSEPKTTSGTQVRKPHTRTKSAPRDARINQQFTPAHTKPAQKKRAERSANAVQANAYNASTPNPEMGQDFNLQNQKNLQEDEPICVLKVELDNGQNVQLLKVFENDNPEVIVGNFAQKFNISQKAKDKLIQRIYEQIS